MNEENEVVETTENTPDNGDVVENSEEAPEETPETPEESSTESSQEDLVAVEHQKFQDQKKRAEKAESERKALEDKLNKANQTNTKDGEQSSALDVEDYIGISTSLEGLDQREKERLAREHKLTGRPLDEIRQDEDFALWQDAYRAKKEKEQAALAPSGKQGDATKPTTLMDRLANASIEEKEAILQEAGLYKAPTTKKDRAPIGDGRGN